MGNTQSKVNSHDRAILEMKIQRDKLKQYQRKIQIVLERESEIARQCLARGDKRRALLALRQKKYQQGLLAKTDEQLVILEQLVRHPIWYHNFMLTRQTSNIEYSLVEKDVLYGLAQGNGVLKAIHKEMSLDKVERILDDSADAVAYQNVDISTYAAHLKLTNLRRSVIFLVRESRMRMKMKFSRNFLALSVKWWVVR